MFKRQRRLPMDEIVSRGKQIYDEKIRSQVDPANIDRIVAIDVESGDFAVADESLAACQLLIDRNPDSQIYIHRIGHFAVDRLGGACDTREKR
jgi:hypothetical protein